MILFNLAQVVGSPDWFSLDEFFIGLGSAFTVIGCMFAFWIIKRSASEVSDV